MCLTAKTKPVTLSKMDDLKFLTKKQAIRIINNKSETASICQRVRKIESHLLDEYKSELCAYKQALTQ